jgi:hypothetical protein
VGQGQLSRGRTRIDRDGCLVFDDGISQAPLALERVTEEQVAEECQTPVPCALQNPG